MVRSGVKGRSPAREAIDASVLIGCIIALLESSSPPEITTAELVFKSSWNVSILVRTVNECFDVRIGLITDR